jgi:RHS repeat-associated protein
MNHEDGTTTTYVYDAGGALAAEYGGPAQTSGTQYLVTDALGSTRLVLSSTGCVTARMDYLPFGFTIPSSEGPRASVSDPCNGTGVITYSQDPPFRQRFTGKERDAETGLDYFGARYFSSAQGRFTTPDPLMASAKASNPQTWNRYAYTLNNPLRYVDPDGMEVPDSCARDSNCPIKVKVNVIYDTTANHGQGLSASQKKQFEQGQLAQAQKDYGASNIKLEYSYTAGTYTVDGLGRSTFTGVQADALNVMVSTGTPTGANGDSQVTPGGYAVTTINVNEAVDTNKAYPFVVNTLEHELVHQFSGDVYRTQSNNFFVAFGQYLSREFPADARVKTRANGVSQTGLREGLEPRRYAVPANPEANKPPQ